MNEADPYLVGNCLLLFKNSRHVGSVVVVFVVVVVVVVVVSRSVGRLSPFTENNCLGSLGILNQTCLHWDLIPTPQSNCWFNTVYPWLYALGRKKHICLNCTHGILQ